nr:7TM GPCR domain containing protein [Haemonchus contortus]
MSSTIAIEDELTEEYCIEYAVNVATAWYYQFSLAISFTTSFLSTILTLYFFYKCYGYSTFFHINLRMLFFSMCLSCLAYDIFNFVIKTHHFALSFLYTKPCDLFLSNAVYIAMNLPTVFVLIMSQYIQFAIVIERWTAIVFVGNYESNYRKVGPVLITAAVAVTALILWIIYHGESFDLPHLNGRWMSLREVVRTNIVLMSQLIVNFIGLVLTVALHYLSPKRRISMSLSTKFQAMENSIVSNYLFMISSCQFSALFFSQAIILYLRIYESENPLVTAYKENADLFNYYTLALPVLSMLYIRKVKNKRNVDIRNTINIKTIGTDGWANYSAVIEKQWN